MNNVKIMAAPPPLTPQQLAALPHDDRGPVVLAVGWGLTAVASLFLALRLYCKHMSRRRLWWDDWVLVAAWVSIHGGCQTIQVLMPSRRRWYWSSTRP